LARECLAIRLKTIPNDWLTFDAKSMVAGSLLARKEYAEAERLLLSSYEGLQQRENTIPLKHKSRLGECLERLARVYDVTEQSDKAAEWKQKLAEFDEAKKARKTAVLE
jgi:hypothetical protein